MANRVMIGHTLKKINSTKQDFTVITTLQFLYKEPCSMHDPILRVQGLPSNKSRMYNYCKIDNNNDGTRFYWIDDIVFLTNDIQEIHCHLDPLATYKTAIGQTSAFCNYADAAHWEQKLDDIRFSPDIEAKYQKVESNYLFNIGIAGSKRIDIDMNTSNWTVIMKYISSPIVDSQWTPTNGWKRGLCTIAMPMSSVYQILGDLYGTLSDEVDSVSTQPTWTDYEIMQGITKIYGTLAGCGSWLENIVALYAIPMPYTGLFDSEGSYESVITVGGVFVDVTTLGVRLLGANSRIYHGAYSLTLPWNEATDPYQNGHIFLCNHRFASFQVYALGQTLELDTTQLINQNAIAVCWAIDIINGNWNIRLVEGKSNYEGTVDSVETMTIGCLTGKLVSVDMLSWVGNGIGSFETFSNAVKGFTSTAAAAIGAYFGGATGALIGAEVGNVVGAFLPCTNAVSGAATGAVTLDNTTPMLMGNSSNASKLLIIGKQWKPAGIANYGYGDPTMPGYCDEYGYPCNKYLMINSCSGFIQCVKASVKGAAGMTANDRTTINGFLNNGFYFE